MLNVSSAELLVVCIVALIVIGPERLPMAVKTAGLWIGRFRRSFYKVKAAIERELNTDEIRRQLHNESVLAEIEEAKSQVKGAAKDAEKSVSNIVSSANFDPGASKSTDVQLEKQKSIQQELEEAGEHVEGITRQAYGSGKNPKLAQSKTQSDNQSVTHSDSQLDSQLGAQPQAHPQKPTATTSKTQAEPEADK